MGNAQINSVRSSCPLVLVLLVLLLLLLLLLLVLFVLSSIHLMGTLRCIGLSMLRFLLRVLLLSLLPCW